MSRALGHGWTRAPDIAAAFLKVRFQRARMWDEAGVEQKQRLQRFVVPTGLDWNGERFGTVTTGWFYSQLQPESASGEGVVELTGFVPVTS